MPLAPGHVADVDPASGRPVGRPRELFTSDHLPGGSAANYDVSPDGARFLMVRGPAQPSTGNVVVVLNWLSTWAPAK
jgi:hypothetical protein